MTSPQQLPRPATEDNGWLIVAIAAAIVAVLALLGLAALLLPDTLFSGVEGGAVSEIVDATQEPIQNNLLYLEPITIEQSPYTWKLTPRARYQIAARVLHTRDYAFDWMSGVSPLDLALGWGQLSANTFDDQLHWRQSGRWVYYSWQDEPPLAASYIREHASNVHIIPATPNLELALKELEVDDIAYLEGLLVDLERTGGDAATRQTSFTSLTRSDAGSGGCEIMYVERLIVAGTEYQ